ncbi:Asp23/Gls24 family envelope stress response protein [Agrococcus jejuensis]|uniref:Uncharacterized protein n=1 Tax=Agrococcus jejuensis TaxID=399736 RepID=A0A1G8DQ95_9MICO|nr:hypothetical protein [Agrococcus jejuensis]SDH59812.1 hypothetical protein SAMN04489720_1735 [Agrococcus jejuensis]
MTTTNRGWNRIVLVLLGIVWLGAGAGLLARQLWPDQVVQAWEAAPQAAADGWASLTAQLGLEVGALDPTALSTVALVAATVLVLVWAIVHAATRGRGRTHDAVEQDDVVIDAGAVEDVYRHALGAHPDVLHVKVTSWRHRGANAWRASVDVRDHARLDEVADRAAAAATATRQRIGIDAPVVVHLTSSIRASVSKTARAA